MNNKKSCNKCTNFTQYYTVDMKTIQKTDIGKCSKNNGTVNIDNYCDNFICKPNITVHSLSLLNCLNEMLTQIYAVRFIIENATKKN